MRGSKQKVKLKGQVTSQQDNLLNERQAAIEKAQAENTALRNELATIKSDVNDKKKKVNVEQYVFSCNNNKKSLSIFAVLICSMGPRVSHNQDIAMCVQSEELTTKLDEAQNLLQSNQQMIQYLAHPLT